MAQVGIGTDAPSATLDVVSHTSLEDNPVLKVRSGEDDELMSVSVNGDFHIKNQLQVNSQPGAAGNLLESKGPNQTHVWSDSDNPLVNKYVAIAYSAEQYISPIIYTGNFVNHTVNLMGEYVSINSTEIGTWNPVTYEYITQMEGIFEVSVGLNIYTTIQDGNRSAVMTIYMDSARQLFRGSNVLDSNLSTDLNGKISRYLPAGSRIFVQVNANREWFIYSGTININFTPKTNA